MMLSSKPHPILVVEDDLLIAKDLQQTLASFGYDAFAIASSAEEAINTATQKCPDLVFMDIKIKGHLDGIETAEILRERFGVPVVYLTAYADNATLERAKKTEPYSYLLKPIKPAELKSTLEISLYKHEMEKRLKERERWLATTLRSMGDAVISTNAAGEITFMNPVAELLTGWRSEDALGQPIETVLKLFTEESKSPEPHPVRQVLEKKSTPEKLSDVLLTKEGTERPISNRVSPLEENGQVVGAVVVFQDASEPGKSRRRLGYSDRLASLGTMAAGVVHEINNPLTTIVANIDLISEEIQAYQQRLSETPDPEQAPLLEHLWSELSGMVAEVGTAAEHIRSIVAALGLFSRPNIEKGHPADLRRVIEWVVHTNAHQFRQRARVTTRLEGSPLIDAPESRLVQVFFELLVNAAQAIPPGHVEQNEVQISSRYKDNNKVIVEISDTGCGMTPEVLQHIFEPFFTTKGLGNGLGLSVCHGVVRSLGGEIQVESQVGKGSVFRVVLPIVPFDTYSTQPAAQAKPARRARILVVDDEPMVLRTIRRILEDEHEVITAESSTEALALLETNHDFDVIFCDLMMPSVTGMDVYEQLLKTRPEEARRVVFLTGGSFTTRAMEFLRSVPNRTLNKPFDINGLRAAVQELLH